MNYFTNGAPYRKGPAQNCQCFFFCFIFFIFFKLLWTMDRSVFLLCQTFTLPSIPLIITFSLHRLEQTFGITDSSFSWFRWYLCGRTQPVSVIGLNSATSTLCYGMPQVLGPVLFVLYTQPLYQIISNHSVGHHAFADDNQLYKDTHITHAQQTINFMQDCFSDIKS